MLDYAVHNPARSVPTIIEGYNTVVSDMPSLIKYLANKFDTSEKFYPLSSLESEKRRNIDAHLKFVAGPFRRLSERLTKFWIEKMLIKLKLITK